MGSERRPTTPPHSHCAAHLPSSRHMLPARLPSTNAELPSLTGAVLSFSTHWVECVKASGTQSYTPVNITHTAAGFIPMSDKRADGGPTVANSNEQLCCLETSSSLLDCSDMRDKNVFFFFFYLVIVTARLF